MPAAALDVRAFLEELVRVLESRMSEQERTAEELRKEIDSLKRAVASLSKPGLQVDSSVIKVLRGE